MTLTTTEKAFITAYIGSANRDAKLAARLARCHPSVLNIPAVQEAIARLSVEATIVDGRIFDANPKPPTLPVEPLSKAEASKALHSLADAALEANMRVTEASGQITVEPKTAAKRGRPRLADRLDRPAIAIDGPSPVLAGTVTERMNGFRDLAKKLGTGQVLPAIEPELSEAENDHVSNTKLNSDLNLHTPPTPRGSYDTNVIPDTNVIAERLAAIKPGATVKSLADKFDRMTDDRNQIPVTTADDGSQHIYDTTMMTPYDIKVFLSQVVRGEHSMDPRIRLQAADLLGKSFGLYSESMIRAEAERAAAPPVKVEDIRARLAETRERLKLLKGEG